MIYTLTFNPAIDYVVQVGGLELGEVNRAIAEDIQFGGKGINVSVLLRNLGLPTLALGFLAGFTGHAVESGLQAMGVQTGFIHLPSGLTRINVKVKAAKETEINGMGPAITDKAMEQLYAKLEQIASGDILVLAGSVPTGMADTAYSGVMQRLQHKNLRIAVDAAGSLLGNTLPHKPFLIKPNLVELGQLFGKKIHGHDEVEQAARELQQTGAQNVLVSMAGEGAALLDADGRFHTIKAPQGQVVNSVGSGDSMVAGFLAGFLKSGSYAHALQMGAAAGSATAFTEGLATKKQIEFLLKTMQ